MNQPGQRAQKESKLISVSKADSDEAIGEFWDTHDFTEFDTDAPDVKFEIEEACQNRELTSSPSGRGAR